MTKEGNPNESRVFSLLENIDATAIGEQFDIGTHSTIHDFEQHVKVSILEGLDPSDSLATLSQKTATHDGVEFMAASTFSELTNARDFHVVGQLVLVLLRSPELYRQRAVDRKRPDWFDRQVVSVDATHHVLDAPVTVPIEGRSQELRRPLRGPAHRRRPL